MIDRPFTVENYLSSPASISLDLKLDCESLAAPVAKMLSATTVFPLLKWSRLKKINAVLIRENKLKGFSFNLSPDLKQKAYMVDSGKIYVSYGLLMWRSAAAALSVYSHEIAHLWLSQREDYDQIKVLQREFKTRYADHTDCGLLFPIELSADLLSLQILKGFEGFTLSKGQKKRLHRQIERRQEKIDFVLKALATLPRH